jgi:hypothetical protein
MNTLTEENLPCQTVLSQNSAYIETLGAIASGNIETFNTWTDNKMVIRILACNILYNIRNELSFPPSQVFTTIMSTIATIFDYDFPALAQKAEAAAKEITPQVTEESLVINAPSPAEVSV